MSVSTFRLDADDEDFSMSGKLLERTSLGSEAMKVYVSKMAQRHRKLTIMAIHPFRSMFLKLLTSNKCSMV